jgi:membrane protease YdiL (CAAX protease family)
MNAATPSHGEQKSGVSTISLPTKRPFSWKVYLFLAVLLAPALYLAVPYGLTLQSVTLEPGEWPMVIVGNLPWLVLHWVVGGIGLLLASRIGLGLPFIEGWLKKEPIWDRFGRVVVISVIVGLAAALVIVGLARWVIDPPMLAELGSLGASLAEGVQPPAWQGFLASVSAGITEEVLLRLFLLTLWAWLGGLVSHDGEGRPTLVVFWIANILSAGLFGAGHLPTVAAMGLPLTALLVARTMMLNSALGLVFGWLYWTRGLESAMIAHFSADIVIHVVLVLLGIPLLS